MTASSADVRRHCKALNITPPATPAEVKTAYRDMVFLWHPDRFTANPRLLAQAETRMREINEAYEALRDGVVIPPPEQAAPPEQAYRPQRAHSAPPPRQPAWVEILSWRLARVHRSIPLPTVIFRPLVPALFSVALVAALIVGAVWLFETVGSVNAPFDAFGLASIGYRIDARLSALTWKFRAVPPPAAAPPAPVTPIANSAPARNLPPPVVSGVPRNGADLIVSSGPRGAGVLHVRNNSELDAAVTLTQGPGRPALRMVYVRAGSATRIDGIGPGEYIVQTEFGRGWRPSSLAFAGSSSRALPAGPLVFVQVQDTSGIRADEYEVVLSPRR